MWVNKNVINKNMGRKKIGLKMCIQKLGQKFPVVCYDLQKKKVLMIFSDKYIQSSEYIFNTKYITIYI